MGKEKKKPKFSLECSDITAGLMFFLVLTMFIIATFYILLQQIFATAVPSFFWASYTMQVFTPVAVGAFAAVIYLLFYDMLNLHIPNDTAWFKGALAMSAIVTFFSVFTWCLSVWLNLLVKRTTMPVYMFATALIVAGAFTLYRCYAKPKDFELIHTDDPPPKESKTPKAEAPKQKHVRKKRRVKRKEVTAQSEESGSPYEISGDNKV